MESNLPVKVDIAAKGEAKLSDLTEPVERIVHRLCNAVGIVYGPFGRVMEAMADFCEGITDAKKTVKVAKILADGGLPPDSIEHQAAIRVLSLEADRLENLTAVVKQTVPQITGEAQPESLDNDKLRKIGQAASECSDPTLQLMWANIMAKECNGLGVSTKTIQVAGLLTKQDAELFQNVCSTCVEIDDTVKPYIHGDFQKIPYYQNLGLTYDNLWGLEEIGLVVYHSGNRVLRWTNWEEEHRRVAVVHGKWGIVLTVAKGQDLRCGHVSFTRAGLDIFRVCQPEHNPELLKLFGSDAIFPFVAGVHQPQEILTYPEDKRFDDCLLPVRNRTGT